MFGFTRFTTRSHAPLYGTSLAHTFTSHRDTYSAHAPTSAHVPAVCPGARTRAHAEMARNNTQSTTSAGRFVAAVAVAAVAAAAAWPTGGGDAKV
jgi:hypothetical protein